MNGLIALLGASTLAFLLGLHMVDGATPVTSPHDAIFLFNTITIAALALWAVLSWIVLKFRGISWWLTTIGSMLITGLLVRLLLSRPNAGTEDDTSLVVFSVVPPLAATMIHVGFSGWAHLSKPPTKPNPTMLSTAVVGLLLSLQVLWVIPRTLVSAGDRALRTASLPPPLSSSGRADRLLASPTLSWYSAGAWSPLLSDSGTCRMAAFHRLVGAELLRADRRGEALTHLGECVELECSRATGHSQVMMSQSCEQTLSVAKNPAPLTPTVTLPTAARVNAIPSGPQLLVWRTGIAEPLRLISQHNAVPVEHLRTVDDPLLEALMHTWTNSRRLVLWCDRDTPTPKVLKLLVSAQNAGIPKTYLGVATKEARGALRVTSEILHGAKTVGQLDIRTLTASSWPTR